MPHSFEIKLDNDIEPETIFIRANLSEMFTDAERKKFLDAINEWAEELYVNDVPYWDEEPEWYEGPEGIWGEIFTDLLTMETNLTENFFPDALEKLWNRFDVFPKITSVMVGSGNEIWPLPLEEED